MKDLIEIILKALVISYGDFAIEYDSRNNCIYVKDDDREEEYKITFESMP